MLRTVFIFGFVYGALVASAAVAQDAKKDVPGVAVGERAPDFELQDQNGKPRKLAEFVQPGQAVALVFYRSADW